jgi:hypothetical protein
MNHGDVTAVPLTNMVTKGAQVDQGDNAEVHSVFLAARRAQMALEMSEQCPQQLWSIRGTDGAWRNYT